MIESQTLLSLRFRFCVWFILICVLELAIFLYYLYDDKLRVLA